MSEKTKLKKRPSDVVSNAVHVMRVLTGETDDAPPIGKDKSAQELGRKGGKARAEKLTPEQRKATAEKAAKARWKTSQDH